MTVYRFWELHPEWKDWRYQLDQMALEVKSRYDKFNGEISCVLVGHFHPYTAKGGSLGAKDLYERYGHCKTHQYYHTHVKQRLTLLTSF